MGTISAIIIICCLIISAALTVVIILVTIPTEITHQSHYSELWINQQSTRHGNFYFHPNKKIPHSLLQNSTVITAIGTASTTITATTTTITATTTTNTITITKTDIDTTTFPNATEILKLTLENDKLLYQSLVLTTTIPMKTWKSNHNRSSQRHTTMLLSTNITVIREKELISSSRQSMTELRHHSAFHESTPRNSRKNLTTLMLHQHIKQLPLNDDNLVKNKREKEQATQMTLLSEITFPNDVKMVGLAMQRGVLYVATNDGRIVVINPETSEQVQTIRVNGKISRMTVTHNVDIIILNGTNLKSYRDGQEYRKIKLPVVGKSLSTFEDEIGLERIIALGGSNDVLFVFTDDLRPIEEIYYKNDIEEMCNFAILYQKYYYVSCQSAILQLSENGEITKKIGANNGPFSLGITIDDQARIIAVVRGQPLLRVFQNGKLQHNLSAVSSNEISAIWSEVLYEKGRLHIADYLTSKLKTFRYPISSTENDA
ncbi:unnamed protein product [Cercopithifilaria johnstoni]|uniref:Uncharacterized protein n=1 Tax=Cercopithifilaria johnstoni TaxID=2874296 RepID=A0A8J2Q6Q0_9BILA|nr:unnamed protein product [Cercopithifilaria johnstoni]